MSDANAFQSTLDEPYRLSSLAKSKNALVTNEKMNAGLRSFKSCISQDIERNETFIFIH